MDIAALAPKAEATVYPWREPKDLYVKTVQQVRDFLRAHQPQQPPGEIGGEAPSIGATVPV